MWTGRAMAGCLVVTSMAPTGAAWAQVPELGQPVADPTAWRCSQPITCTKVGTFDGRSGIWSVDRSGEEVVIDVRFTTFWVLPEVPRSPIAEVSRRPGTDAAAWFDQQVDRLRAQGWTIGAHGADFAELNRLGTKLEVARWTASLHGEDGSQVMTTAVQARWCHYSQ